MEIVHWHSVLEDGKYDKKAGIKIAKLCGEVQFSTYLTCIDSGKSVNAHYHKQGDEHYHIVEGTGEIQLVDIATKKSTVTSVGKGCSFVVEANKIHQLKNTGSTRLILMFSCPESHLTNDRFVSLLN